MKTNSKTTKTASNKKVSSKKAAPKKAAAKKAAVVTKDQPFGEVKAKKEKGPKRIPQTYVLCELIVTQEYSDEDIAKTASKKLNKEVTVRDVRIIRSSINKGLRVGTGFPVPKKELVEVVYE